MTTGVALTPNPASSAYSVPVTLTAALSPYALAQGHIPGGSVTFFNGATNLGTVPVTSASTSLTVSSLPVGADSLSAVYSGDTNFASSTGNSSTNVIPNFSFTFTSATPTPNVVPGSSAQYSLQIAPLPTPSNYPA